MQEKNEERPLPDQKFPKAKWIEAEWKKERHKTRLRRILRSTLFSLIAVAAAAILVATLWMPVLKIFGKSMTPTLHEGELLVSVKSGNYKPGDIIAFYYNNKVLIKRVIGAPGDWINMDKDGTVYVNDKKLDEPYVKKKAFGDCDIKLPYQVPESRVFVMGDHRDTSLDSRKAAIGCVAKEQVVGILVFRIWPFDKIGFVK